jgi:hypothetical protein
MVQQGPAAAWLKSSTFTPSRGNMLSPFKNQKSKVKNQNDRQKSKVKNQKSKVKMADKNVKVISCPLKLVCWWQVYWRAHLPP